MLLPYTGSLRARMNFCHGFVEHRHGDLSLLAVLGVEAFLGGMFPWLIYEQPVLSH